MKIRILKSQSTELKLSAAKFILKEKMTPWEIP